MMKWYIAVVALLLIGVIVIEAIPDHATNNNNGNLDPVSADVFVYEATAAGCIAGIAASRSGAKHVVITSTTKYIGGMTTGGIMHADVGNDTIIHGITLEYWQRVMSHYPPPSPSATPQYGCIANRCVELANGKTGSQNSSCNGKCAPLEQDEWLAVNFLSTFSNDNKTLTVTLPKNQNTSYLKKSERPAATLSSSMKMEISEGQVFQLTQPSTVLDTTYDLIKLQPSMFDQDTPPPIHPGAPPGWLYESHIAEQVLDEMVQEANITVVREIVGIASVVKTGTVLKSITSVSGIQFTADVFIDGSYEGDLAYAAGADMTWGREAESQYNEPGAGLQPASLNYDVNPYWPDGSLIPHVSSSATMVPVGDADKRIEVYDFRLCFTNSPSHRIPIWKPESYNASEWEFWRRLWKNGTSAPKDLRGAGLGCLGPIPNNFTDCGDKACVKCDMLGMVHSTDMLNGAWGYPNGTLAERTQIRQAHIEYTLGLLWFYATDPASGDAVHEEMATLGHCNDEYDATSSPPHWPYQLYVREARRLVGDFVWTEIDPPQAIANRSVGMGSYSFDCHWVTLYNTSSNGVAAEGRVNNGRNGTHSGGVGQEPYVIPYDALLPKSSQVTNVLVAVACSTSHLRFNAIRMEPTWMIIGHAAGTAAALAIASTSSNVQQVDVNVLQKLLLVQQQQIQD